MILKDFLIGFVITAVLIFCYDGYARIRISAAASKPEWTAKYCPYNGKQDAPSCVSDTLNMLYADRAVDAKIVTVVGCESGCNSFYVWYRK